MLSGQKHMNAVVTDRMLIRTEPPTARLDFQTVYRKHYADVVRWTRALGGPDMDAEDLTQDVFIVVHKKLAVFEDENLRGWLYAIAANLVSDRRRGAWFRRIFSRPRDVLLEELRDHGDDPLRQLERKDAQRIFHALAAEIHASRREAFLLFEVGGLSGAEIAALQRVPLATVWTRLHLARKEFLSAVSARRKEARS
jgi:RNA polymerase sigma-70 factor (ECF subfamily)